MLLHTREWGRGDRVALLIHGMMSDSRTWRRVGPALADRGYRVVAVDLRGHGRSPRGEYSPELFADDLVDTLPAGADLALGHSLGALALSLAAGRLVPRRAVYSDPAWRFARPAQGLSPLLFAGFKNSPREHVAVRNPRWAPADIDVELETLRLWDPRTAAGLARQEVTDRTPEKPCVPSLVQLADPSFLVPPGAVARLRRAGFEVRTVRGAGHTIHRDDFHGFMDSLAGWV